MQRFKYINYPVACYKCEGRERSHSLKDLDALRGLIRYLRNERNEIELKIRMPIQWAPSAECCTLVKSRRLLEKRLYPIVIAGDNSMFALTELGDLYYFLNRNNAKSYDLEIDDLLFTLKTEKG